MAVEQRSNHAEQALLFLQQSDEEFDAGDELQGSEKLWGAAAQAVMAVVEHHGKTMRQSHEALKYQVKLLAEKHNDPLLKSGFKSAEMFHANFYHWFMDDFQLEEERPEVRQFVDRMLALID